MKKIIIFVALAMSAAFCFAEKSYFGQLEDFDGKHTDGVYDKTKYERTGEVITYTAKDLDGSKFISVVAKLKKGQTLVLDGSEGVFYFSDTAKLRASGVTIKGVNNAVLDFKNGFEYNDKQIQKAIEAVRKQAKKGNGHFLSTYDKEMSKSLGAGRGLEICGEYNLIEDLVIQNASDNGLLISYGGNFNIIKNVETRFNGDAGIQLNGKKINSVDCSEDFEEDGPHDNKFLNCYSHDNCDPWNLGENADGFAVKAGVGDFNYFENCRSEYNSDDGWDCFRIRGSCTLVNCQANYNGLNSATKEAWGEYANGNGFKMGGGSKDSYPLHPHAQYLKDCTAIGNRGNSGVGFDRNNQHGSLYLVNCFATDNHANLMRNGTLRHQDYSIGEYGKKCYLENCSVGSENDVPDSVYAEYIKIK